eukprot:3272918-Prymnesium_polylepis.1
MATTLPALELHFWCQLRIASARQGLAPAPWPGTEGSARGSSLQYKLERARSETADQVRLLECNSV